MTALQKFTAGCGLGLALGFLTAGSFGSMTYSHAFCRPGYAASIRPPYWWSYRIKRQIWRESRDLTHGPGYYELDHRIPLELGGCPTCRWNLQLQPWDDARLKDADENRLHDLVCDGKMSLAEAERRIWEWKP